jgi:hypothetical protein
MTGTLALADYAATHARELFERGAPPCKVCGGSTRLFDVVDFGRQCNVTPYPDGVAGVPVYYHRCSACGLLFTTFFDSFDVGAWSRHVYNADYSRIDPDYGDKRAHRNAGLILSSAKNLWSTDARGCDYGGGLGATADRLRAMGLQFDTCDPFGKQDKDVRDGAYRMVSAFEVLEHVPDPLSTFARMVALLGDGPAWMLVSTAISDEVRQPGDLSRWWYAAPRNGHITLHAEASLRYLGQINGLQYRKVTKGLHLFGRGVRLASLARSIFVKKIVQRALGM